MGPNGFERQFFIPVTKSCVAVGGRGHRHRQHCEMFIIIIIIIIIVLVIVMVSTVSIFILSVHIIATPILIPCFKASNDINACGTEVPQETFLEFSKMRPHEDLGVRAGGLVEHKPWGIPKFDR